LYLNSKLETRNSEPVSVSVSVSVSVLLRRVLRIDDLVIATASAGSATTAGSAAGACPGGAGLLAIRGVGKRV
jgi:hypothetical protein